MKGFSLDSSLLIEIYDFYNTNRPDHQEIMKILHESLKSGYFRISEYVLSEIENDTIQKLIKNDYPNTIIIDSEETQLIVKGLQRSYPSVINPRSPKRNRGDFFVIATAIEHKLRVLTMEKKVKNVAKKSVLNVWKPEVFKKIPEICLKENIDCLDMTEFMAELMSFGSKK